MPKTDDGRRPARQLNVVRLVLTLCAVLAIAAAGGIFFLRILPLSFAVDLPKTFSAIDAALSDPSRYAEASVLIGKAEKAVGTQEGGVESTISVLKRRRTLARLKSAEYGRAYLTSALAAAALFPSADITAAAVVDAALLIGDASADAVSALKSYALRLPSESFGALKTEAYLHLGELGSAGPALPPAAFLAAADAYLPRRPELAALLCADAAVSAFLSDDALLGRTILRDRLSDHDVLSPAVLRFLAEAAYDFGDKRESASLFSRIDDDASRIRRADASYLAGDAEEARLAWVGAAAGKNADIALYNLSSEARSAEEALEYARRLHSAFPLFAPGVVRLSRLSEAAEARTMLASAMGKTQDPRIALESIRIDSPRLGTARTQPRLWLLMNANPSSELSARWAAWYLTVNGLHSEAARVVDSYRRIDPSAVWTDYYLGLDAARAGRLDDAEKAFERVAAAGGDWRSAANSAAVSEALRKPAEALKRYRIALSLKPGKADASELHLRCARLLKSMGKDAEARQMLEYAYSIDPDNRRVRMELKK